LKKEFIFTFINYLSRDEKIQAFKLKPSLYRLIGMTKRWIPVAYYYTAPLAKLAPPSNKLPHPLGYIPPYLKKREQELTTQPPVKSPQ
jgi:hypothetical protein